MAISNAAAARELGRAESTLLHDKAAHRLWKAYRHVKQLPEVMHADEIKGEMLQEYMLNVGNYFANRPIAHNFNENLEPSNPENLKCLLPNTISYIGKFVVHIRTEIDPDHTDFTNLPEGDNFPRWYTAFRSEFESAAARFQLTHNGDEVLKCTYSYTQITKMQPDQLRKLQMSLAGI